MGHKIHSEDHQSQEPPRFWRSRYGLGLLVMGAVAAYFLLQEHWAHVAGLLPYLFFAACPLMHIFMHHGHGHGHGHGHHSTNDPGTKPPGPDKGAGANNTGEW